VRTFTFEQASENLKDVILGAIRDKEEAVIASDEGAVVIVDESEWSQIKETLRLLSDNESLTSLLESHAIRERGEKPEGITPEEAFKDV
jgi:PHD/YefM family antitoxin component YafN of YafNO toxin-antitoxin module